MHRLCENSTTMRADVLAQGGHGGQRRLGRRLGWVLLLVLGCPAGAARAQSGPLSLEEAIGTALRAHPQVQASRAGADAAAERVPQARAGWLPQVTHTAQAGGAYRYQTGIEATGGVDCSVTPSAFGCPAKCLMTPTDPDCLPGAPRSPETRALNYNVQLSASQLIYDFGRVGGRMAAARAGARAAGWDLAGTQVQVVYSATTAYYGVLAAEALDEVGQRNLAQQQQRLAQAESFFQIGTRPEIDVLTARTAVAQAQLQVLRNKNGITSTRVQLLSALGVPATDDRLMTRPLQAAPPAMLPEEGQPLEQVAEPALRKRPEYQALRERLAQAEAQVRVVRSDFFPSLSLGATAGLSGNYSSTAGQFVNSSSGQATQAIRGEPLLAVVGSLNLNWPILSGWQTVHAVREAESLQRQAQANLEVLRQQVLAGVKGALIQVQTAREAAVAATAVVRQAEMQLEMATGRYQAGVGNIIELGDAQVGATTARQQRVQTDYDLALARAALRLQLGQLLPAGASRTVDRAGASQEQR